MIKKIAFFFVLILVFFYLMDELYDKYVIKDNRTKTYWALNQENKSYDFAILGSSRALGTLDPKILIENTNFKNGVNLGLEGIDYREIYLLTKLFLGNNNTVKNLFIQTDVYSLDTSFFSYPFHEYKYLPLIEDKEVFRVIKQFYGKKAYLWKYIPFLKYTEYNYQIGFKNFTKGIIGAKGNYSNTLGYNKPSKKMINKETYEYYRDQFGKGYNIKIQDFEKIYFEKILKLAKKNHMNVVLFNAPEYIKMIKFQKNREKIIKYYNDRVSACGFFYYNIQDSEFVKNNEYFQNYTHVNQKGSNLFSKMFADFLNQINSYDK